MPRSRLLAAPLVCALVAGGFDGAAHAATAPAEASPAAAALAPLPVAPRGTDLAAGARSIADAATTRWALLQEPDGHFPDPVSELREDYGSVLLGLAMARRGTASGNAAQVQRGLDAIQAIVEHPAGGPFEPLVFGEAYRWGEGRLADAARYAPMWAPVRTALRRDLTTRVPAPAERGAPPCLRAPDCWNNLKLVGALAGEVLLDTRLHSSARGAFLADPALAATIRTIARTRIPGQTGDRVARTGAAPLAGGGILSDPTRDPLAYHALSTAFLGRLLDEMGGQAPAAGRRALARLSRALLALTAPSGDITWWGRGQGQVWTNAIIAEAAARAAVRAAPGSTIRRRYLGLVATEIERLRTAYGIGAWGLPLVPGAGDAATLLRRSVDSYATTRGYNGLAVDALDRTAALLAGITDRTAATPSSLAGVTRSPVQADVATLTRGDVWAAIAAHSQDTDDARYAAGLLAMQLRGPSGTWTPAIPARPHRAARLATLSAVVAGEHLPLWSHVRRGTSSTSVETAGSWGKPGSERRTTDPGTVWTWSLGADRTLAVRFTARAPRTYALTALAGSADVVARTRTGVRVTRPDGIAVSYAFTLAGRRPSLQRSRRTFGASAYDEQVRGIELRLRARRGDRVVVRISVASPASVAAPVATATQR